MAEARGLHGLKPGDEIVIISSSPRGENPRSRNVKIVGPRWVTTENGLKYAVTTGEEREHFGFQDRALTVPQWQEHVERRKLLAQLDRWGMAPRKVPVPERELTLAQLRRVAALLAEFELPPVPAPEDPDAAVYIEVNIEPSWAAIPFCGYVQLTEGEIAARPPSQAREDRITDLCDSYVNDAVGWGASEIGELPPGAEIDG